MSMNGDEVYFMNKNGEIWSYDSTDTESPQNKVNNSYRQSRQYSSLAIINGLPTVIGGLDDQGLGNIISNTLSLVSSEMMLIPRSGRSISYSSVLLSPLPMEGKRKFPRRNK